MNLKKESLVQIGNQPRDGIFGGIFYIEYNTADSTVLHAHILTARPKSRIWKAELNGRVECTYKLQELVKDTTLSPIYGVNCENTNLLNNTTTRISSNF
ncbi:hypothetical protein, partial [Salmonella sp. s51228]|uniref:hypothetical protein n=1 Tax=Salmonella sp. s51228 TaxID=3159652 RepID=UPI00398082DD